MPVRDRISAVEADITRLTDVDAIVNAANERMLGGGGVDGAIHRAAGPQLREECEKVPEVSPGVRCPTGQARLTKGYNLNAKFVLHTVGPVWHGGGHGEDELLANCYRNSLKIALDNRIRSLAFPAISTGVYRFPLDRATKIAVREVGDFISKHPEIERVVFACFGTEALHAYQAELARFGA